MIPCRKGRNGQLSAWKDENDTVAGRSVSGGCPVDILDKGLLRDAWRSQHRGMSVVDADAIVRVALVAN